jgi:hypothetical protein
MATSSNVDLDAVARLVEQLERDLARVRAGSDSTETLRAEVEQLRGLLARAAPPSELHAGLSGVRERLHALTDEVLNDLVKSGDYVVRIGRLLGM